MQQREHELATEQQMELATEGQRVNVQQRAREAVHSSQNCCFNNFDLDPAQYPLILCSQNRCSKDLQASELVCTLIGCSSCCDKAGTLADAAAQSATAAEAWVRVGVGDTMNRKKETFE